MTGGLEHLADLRKDYGALDGMALLRAVLREGPLHRRTALVSSFGAESAVLLDLVTSVDPCTPVIFLDTGKLFPETQSYREELTDLLGLRDVRVVRPDPLALLHQDRPDSLWQREPNLCCQVRKTEPLERALKGFGAWITGRKRFHGGARHDLQSIEGDPATGRLKLNPLARWTSDDVERYRVLRGLPEHPLVDQGYRSIGCAPCTRPAKPGESLRAGRWAELEKTECGIHGQGI